MANTLIVFVGLLAMLVCFAAAWWLWVHDPRWPWVVERDPARRALAGAPTAPSTTPATPPAKHAAPVRAPAEPAPQAYTPPPQMPISDATQILPDAGHFPLGRDEDAPMAGGDQLTTQPVPRAGPPHRAQNWR